MYATLADMIARYGAQEMIRLSAAPGQALPVEPVAARVETALRDASELVDSYLSRMYAIPLSAIPESVRQHVCAIARFNLAHGDDREPTKQMIEAHAAALAWLKDVGAGRAVLPLAPATPQGQAGGGARVAVRPGELSADTRGAWA
jgi:phage gp36-like protein